MKNIIILLLLITCSITQGQVLFYDDAENNPVFTGTNGGITWSTFNNLPKVYNYCLPWGDLISLDTAGHYMIPYYESNFGTGQIFAVKAHKTTDSGATWSQQTIYSGTTYHINESWAVNCGSGRIVMLCRRSTYWGQTGNLMQITSSDGGATWSAPVDSNLGSIDENIPCLYYDNITDLITVIYQDRDDGFIKVSTENDPDTVIASATSWNTPQNYEYNNDPPDNGHNGIGYPSYNGEICIWTKEVSATVCDIKWRQENMSTF